ncbi:MAG TPA: CvpA family protein [Arcobacter sp.]|nr:CvpA family protein [Arcobacter sp.]
MENLNYFDIIVLALIVLLGLKGLLRGFIKEAFALIGIIGGVFVASRIAQDTGNLIDGFIPMSNSNTVLLVGFIVSLIAIWLIAYFLGIILSKMFSLSGLGIFDRFLGFAFGAGKVFLLFSIIAYAASQIDTFKTKLDEKLNNSFMYPVLVDSGATIIKLDTGKMGNTISNGIDSVVDSTKETMEDISIDIVKEKIEKLTNGESDGK